MRDRSREAFAASLLRWSLFSRASRRNKTTIQQRLAASAVNVKAATFQKDPLFLSLCFCLFLLTGLPYFPKASSCLFSSLTVPREGPSCSPMMASRRGSLEVVFIIWNWVAVSTRQSCFGTLSQLVYFLKEQHFCSPSTLDTF